MRLKERRSGAALHHLWHRNPFIWVDSNHPRFRQGVDGVEYAGLALNAKGYERAIACGVDLVQYVVPMSESFAEKNQGTTVEAATEVALELAAQAKQEAA